MEQSKKVDFSYLVNRYEYFKKLWFSPLSDPQYDDESGEELPNANMSKAQIMESLKLIRVKPPLTPTERVIRFIDGSEFNY